METLSIILGFCIGSMSIAQEDIFWNEGSGTFQNNPASYGNQKFLSVNTFVQQ